MFKYVSGGSPSIYGALPPADLSSIDTSDALTFEPQLAGVSCLGEIFGPTRYRWPLDAAAFHGSEVPATELVADFQRSSHQTSPSVQLMQIADATVINNAIYCGNGLSQRILYESFRGCEWGATTRANIPVHDYVEGPDLTDERFIDVYFGTVGYFNYGQWLVDDLPKIKGLFILMKTADRPIRLILPSHNSRIDEIRSDSLRLLLDESIAIEFIPPQEPRRFRHLHYISPVSYHPVNKSPIALDFLVHHTVNRTSDALPARPTGQAKRLFAIRGSVAVRKLLNEAAVVDRLRGLDFNIIDPLNMSFAEQVSEFSQATVVVGQMGAAMTNTLFCRPTTAVIYLAPNTWREPFYLDLAATRGHYYQVLFGASGNEDLEPHMRDFSINLDHLEEIIRAL